MSVGPDSSGDPGADDSGTVTAAAISLGVAGTIVTGPGAVTFAPNPAAAVVENLPPVPAGLIGTDRPQRAAALTRASGVTLAGGRPQRAPLAPMYSSSFFTTASESLIEDLEADALSIDTGSDWRFLAIPAYKSVAPDPLTGFDFGVLLAAITKEGQHENYLEFPALILTVPPIDDFFAYYARTYGDPIVRPALEFEGSPGLFRLIAPWGSPLTAFTFAFCAMLHEGDWTFCDLIASYDSTATTAQGAKLCTLRYDEDLMQVWIQKRLVCEYVVNPYRGTYQGVSATSAMRPVIVVFSIDAAAGTGVLCVYCVGGTYQEAFSFAPLGSLDPAVVIGAPGMNEYTGSTLNDDFIQACARMELMDMSVWNSALSLEAAHDVANKLDSVYGVTK